MSAIRAPLADCRLSVNRQVAPWVERLCAHADALRVLVQRDDTGVRLVDAGIAARGGVAAGIVISEICMAGFGNVRLRSGAGDGWPSWLDVRSSAPLLACLASQYAGWSLAASKEEQRPQAASTPPPPEGVESNGKATSTQTDVKKFFALGSGPARALAAKEPLFDELGYRDHADRGVLVLEVDRVPPAVVLHKVLRDCALAPDALTVVLTPTTSVAGTTQVVARVLEVALHKAHELGFALGDIVDGAASAPLPIPSPDAVQAMGRTNDAILYGGRVHLSVRGSDAAAHTLAAQLPSATSRDFGRSFAEIFEAAGRDFYKIDRALFAPAEVWVSNLDSGRSWHGGAIDIDLLRRLWLEDLA